MKTQSYILIMIFFLLPFCAFPQDTVQKKEHVRKQDTVAKVKKQKGEALKPYHWNVFKYNPTTYILWNNQNFTFSYERLINRRQSATITVGKLVFKPLTGDTIAGLIAITSRDKSGINFSVDYRFYLWKRNSRPAPDGIYIAPYYAFYGYKFTNGFDIINTPADSIGKIKGRYYAHNVGFQLGYQFVFWKRLTLDFLLFGPSIAYYGGQTNISGNLSLEQIKELNEDLYNKIIQKFPAGDNLFVDHTFEQEGQLKLISMGLRFAIQIGFHF